MKKSSVGNATAYVLKNSKEKDSNLKYDFMPDLQEIINRPAHIAGKVIITAVTVLLVFAVVWAHFARLDILVCADGKISSTADLELVKADISGKISAIYVHKGDAVSAGEIFCTVISDISGEELDIKVPESGTVVDSSVEFIGQDIYSTDNVAVILPCDGKMILEAYVKNSDIKDVHIGDEAKIKLQAYPYSDYGAVSGYITYISKAPVTDTVNSGSYMIKIEPDKLHSDIDMVYGLNGTAEIKIGERSVLDYILDPVRKGINNSLKEK